MSFKKLSAQLRDAANDEVSLAQEVLPGYKWKDSGGIVMSEWITPTQKFKTMDKVPGGGANILEHSVTFQLSFKDLGNDNYEVCRLKVAFAGPGEVKGPGKYAYLTNNMDDNIIKGRKSDIRRFQSDVEKLANPRQGDL